MRKQRTIQEYRTIDLSLFALMLALCEFVIIKVAGSGFFQNQLYTVSLAASVTTIVYMRWGAWGAVHAALSGFLFCLYSGGTGDQYVIYVLGNLFSLAAVPLLKGIGYEKVRLGQWLSMLFPLTVILLMQTGRAMVSLVLGASPNGVLGFFTTDILSDLFTLVVIWIARRLDGIYENQRHYLLRIQHEQE